MTDSTQTYHRTLVNVVGMIPRGKEWTAINLPCVDPHNNKYIRVSEIPEELLEQVYGKMHPRFYALATTGANLCDVKFKDWELAPDADDLSLEDFE